MKTVLMTATILSLLGCTSEAQMLSDMKKPVKIVAIHNTDGCSVLLSDKNGDFMSFNGMGAVGKSLCSSGKVGSFIN